MKINKLFSLFVLGGMTVAPGAFAATSGSAPVGLAEKIRHEMVMTPYFNVFDDLSFRLEDGAVTLFGQVTEPVVKNDVERRVKHIEGVQRVDNQIEVLPLSTFDNQIRLRTYFSIYGYGPLERYSLGVQPPIRILVKNGNVTLAGVVATEADKQLAFLRANGVPGVFSVTNDLRVER